MKVESRTFYSSKYDRTFVYKKISENKRALYEYTKPYQRYDEDFDEYLKRKPKLCKVQEKEYSEYWIRRKTNYNLNPHEMPLKRKSQVPRMNKLEKYQGAMFEIKESGGNMQADLVMNGTIAKNGDIVHIDKMRNGFTEHIWWDENNVRKSKIRPQIFDIDETNCREISKLAKRFLKKFGKTLSGKVK